MDHYLSVEECLRDCAAGFVIEYMRSQAAPFVTALIASLAFGQTVLPEKPDRDSNEEVASC
jgi:hypothetical protein